MSTAPAKDQLFEPAGEPIGGYEFGAPPSHGIGDHTDSLHSSTSGCSSRCNIGHSEQKIRLAVGTGFLAAAAFAPVSRGWKIGFAAVGISQLVMGATRFCPLWQALGVDTRKTDER